MTGFDGTPLPPIDDAPSFPLEAFLALSIGIALLVAIVWFLAVQTEIRREREHDDKMRETRLRIESHREEIIQDLIEQSPGGRKTWQDRRTPGAVLESWRQR